MLYETDLSICIVVFLVDFSDKGIIFECSTTVGDILQNVDLRKSLELELTSDSQKHMVEYISKAFSLEEDKHKSFVSTKDLNELHTILDSYQQLNNSIHLLMETLVKYVEAKDFIRKLAMRETTCKCKKCMELLHTVCRNEYSAIVV